MSQPDDEPAASRDGAPVARADPPDEKPVGTAPQRTDGVPSRSLRVRTASSFAYTGPIPAPGMLAEYEKVYPGLGKIIVDGFVAEGEHRREGDRVQWAIVRDLSSSEVENSRRGMHYALTIALAMVGLALVVALTGYPWPAAVIVGGDIVALVTVFITGRRYDAKERAENGNVNAANDEDAPPPGTIVHADDDQHVRADG